MRKRTLPRTLARFAEAHVGAVIEVDDLSHPGGNAETFRIHGSARAAIVKVYRSARTFRQELRAYLDWLPTVPDTPALLDHREEATFALLLEALPGAPLATVRVPVAAERALHARAGAWLGALHAVEVPDRDPMSLEEAYRTRIRDWHADTDGWRGTGARLARWVRERVEDLPERLRGTSRVPCHLDFEPRNWLVREDGRWVAVFDFEHARPDHPHADLARLAAYVWPARPDLAGAFLAAYRGPVGAVDLETVDRLAILEAARRLAWAQRRGDDALGRSARLALHARGAPGGG